MNTQAQQSSLRAAKLRVEEGLEALRIGPSPDVAGHMLDRYCPNERHYVNSVRRNQSGGELNVYVQSKAPLDAWEDRFRHAASMGTATLFATRAMDARASAARRDRREPSLWSVQPESRPLSPGGLLVLRVDRRYA